MNDFYVGYFPKAPSALARFVGRLVIALALLTLTLALVLLLGQGPFANSAFEYGKKRTFEGVIEMAPYPALLVARPGKTESSAKDSRYLLVAPGKHGADGLIAGLNGKRVRLQGQLIYRSSGTMVEIEPGSITTPDTAVRSQPPARDLGPATLDGEMVDSKCYLGVMNPGQGKVHRDCAVRCLSGGIPPLFVISDTGVQVELVDPEGHALGPDVLREFVGESLKIRGEMFEIGETRQLRILASALRHRSREESLRPVRARK